MARYRKEISLMELAIMIGKSVRTVDEMAEDKRANVLPLKDLFHISHFSRFYILYVPASILVGLVFGLFMVAFQLLIAVTTTAFSALPLFIAPLIGGIFSGALIFLGRNEIEGSGISKAIEMTHTPTSLRKGTTITKMVATSISIGSGNPVGREGPAVLIGAGIGNQIGRRLGFEEPSHLRVFLMMGSAAATAGIYKAPLGGALFATEAPYKRDAQLGYFVPTVIAAITSFIVFSGIYSFITQTGPNTLFTFYASYQFTIAEMPLLILFGVVAGLVSILFAVSLMATRNFFTLKLPDWADPIFGSLLACGVIFIALLVAGPQLSIAGMGYDVINFLAENPQPILILVILLFSKLFASSFVVAGRVSGGVLASSLFVGAMLGSIFGEIFHPGNVAGFMVLGMGAVLAATTNTPVATTVMMLEMSLSFDLVIPLVICITVSYLVSAGTSLYEGQKISRDDESVDFYASTNILPDSKVDLRKSTGDENIFDTALNDIDRDSRS
ncbi:MAG: chloride channel protein [Candidatus Thorarchaeota archaeon]|nr:MAG: chloride channel protein [Candidatus Thorarchaeota archaeon]